MEVEGWLRAYRAWIDALPPDEQKTWMDGIRLRRFLQVQSTENRPVGSEWKGTTFRRDEHTMAVGYYIRTAVGLVWKPIPRVDYLFAAALQRQEIEDEQRRRRVRRRWRVVLDLHSWNDGRLYLPIELAHHAATLAGF